MKKVLLLAGLVYLFPSVSFAKEGNTPQNILIAGGLAATYYAGNYLWESLKIKSSYLQAKEQIELEAHSGKKNTKLAAIEHTIVEVTDNLNSAMREEKNRQSLSVLAAGLCVTTLAFFARN